MSYNSELVKNWRKRTKHRLVESLGGKCCCCGYNKCDEALEFHHRDPKEKDIGIGAIRASNISWKRIVEEIRKCTLVCSNCHKEIHRGITTIPCTAPVFDERYANYKDLEIQEKRNPCPVCG
jgi:hypothetical protein